MQFQPPIPAEEDDEASPIPTEHALNGQNLSAGNRKVAKRTFPFDLEAGETIQLVLSRPQYEDEDIRETTRARLEESLPTALADEATLENTLIHTSAVVLLPPDADAAKNTVQVPQYVLEQRRRARRKYRKTVKGRLAHKADHEKRRKPVSGMLKVTLGPNLIAMAKTEVIKLLLSPWDSDNGISSHFDTPLCDEPLLAVTRPGVFRTSFGLDCRDKDQDNYNFQSRYIYESGSGSNSNEMNPLECQTKPMSHAMVLLATAVQDKLRQRKSCNTTDLSDAFNSVTILLYMGSDVIRERKESSLGFHCDTEYTAKGEFVSNNSQKQNTPVVVLTLGDERTLHMKKRFAASDGTWINNENEKKTHAFVLTDESIFVLHPDDEVPRPRGYSDGSLSQFQHGGVNVTEGLSVAIIFRTVTTKADMHITRNTRRLGPKDREYMSTEIALRGARCKPRQQHFKDAHKEGIKLKADMEEQLQAYVEKRIENKTLFN
jgi:hypothetical protein